MFEQRLKNYDYDYIVSYRRYDGNWIRISCKHQELKKIIKFGLRKGKPQYKSVIVYLPVVEEYNRLHLQELYRVTKISPAEKERRKEAAIKQQNEMARSKWRWHFSN